MSARLQVPRETADAQARAADPGHSVWVSANAGSGKTHVLSRRVVRLLLDGTDASRILCLTYTKAAAANMVNKVFADLGKWAVMDESALSQAITGLEGRPPDAARLALARQLFARALETPGGLKIQTIHAFCEAVLHQFPLEANIAGHFEMLDAQMEQALVAEARRELLTGTGGHDPALARAFGYVLAEAGEHGLDKLLANIVAERDGLRDFLNAIHETGDQIDCLKREFGLQAAETTETIALSAWPDSYFTPQMAHDFLSRGEAAAKVKATEFGARLKAACELTGPLSRFDALRDLFLRYAKGQWIARSAKGIASKGVGEHYPDFADEFDRYAGQLLAARDRIALLQTVEATDAALTIADRLTACYQRLKSARGFLDFNDLITRTVNLLARQDAGPWVQYKLDRGLDHILIDEAQDTSPGQWTVIRELAGEFFTGQSARSDVNRTIFAVGDEKQSIYSFQGAEPAAFAESGQTFAKKIATANARFRSEKLQYSFRSVGDILSAVDLVFESENARRGLTVLPEPVNHSPVRANDPGFVDIWPLVRPEAVDEPDDWTLAIDHASAPAVRLAEAVARHICQWIDNGETIEGKGRRLRPGDIMVLVRKRDSFVHALSRALKNLDVNVAGADRLKLRDHIAIKDLIALGRFAVQPHDDLSLAALLRSPVFGVTDKALFDIAHDRGRGVSLWRSLQATAEHNAQFGQTVECLRQWRNEAGYRSPVEFYGAILGRDGVRAAMIARLGHEAGEILDEFMNYVFSAEKAGITGLGVFLETLDNASPEIKREIAQTRDEVRIMTVHAAKGLEAPVVFLVDNGSAPFVHQHLPELLPFAPETLNSGGKGYLWSAGNRSELSGGIGKALKESAEEEYRRLLYVGMTRAEDRLIICGYHGVMGPAQDTWYGLVHDALAGKSRPAGYAIAGMEGEALRYRANDLPPAPLKESDPDEAQADIAFPGSLRDPLPPEISLPRPFAPSGAAVLVDPSLEQVASDVSPVLGEAAQPSLAIERGIAIHRLLQVLPDISPSDRETAAKRYLEWQGGEWSGQDRRGSMNSVVRILSDPRFAEVFAEGSRAEVTIAGHLTIAGQRRAVSGKIDRLAIGTKGVLIVDYKTNRVPPKRLEQVPPQYVAQIAIYAALLRQIYPDRTIRAGLLFTETPDLIDIPETVMNEALERLAVS